MYQSKQKKIFIRLGSVFLMLAFVLVLVSLVPASGIAQTTPAPNLNTGATNTAYTGSYCTTAVTAFNNLSDLFKYFTCSLQRLVLPLLFTVAGLVFVWGTVKFISSRDSAEKEEGQQFMLWGVIAFPVMLALWGLIGLIGTTFHISNVLPTVPVTDPPKIQ